MRKIILLLALNSIAILAHCQLSIDYSNVDSLLNQKNKFKYSPLEDGSLPNQLDVFNYRLTFHKIVADTNAYFEKISPDKKFRTERMQCKKYGDYSNLYFGEDKNFWYGLQYEVAVDENLGNAWLLTSYMVVQRKKDKSKYYINYEFDTTASTTDKLTINHILYTDRYDRWKYFYRFDKKNQIFKVQLIKGDYKVSVNKTFNKDKINLNCLLEKIEDMPFEYVTTRKYVIVMDSYIFGLINYLRSISRM